MTSKRKYNPEELQLALERGLRDPTAQFEGGFAWASLIPFIGPLVNPIVGAIGNRIGSWINGKGLASPGAGLFRTGMGLRRTGTGKIYNSNDMPLKRGSTTPQQTIPDMGMQNVDRFTSSHLQMKKGGASETQAVAMLKHELQPYVNDPEGFKTKLASLIQEGKAYAKSQGGNLIRTGGRIGKGKKKKSKK